MHRPISSYESLRRDQRSFVGPGGPQLLRTATLATKFLRIIWGHWRQEFRPPKMFEVPQKDKQK